MRLLLLLTCFLPIFSYSQNKDDWHLLDPENDHLLGISSNRAYEYLKGKKADTVIVAIIDNGAELTHIDLQHQFWVNKNEIENNGIDDDHNGYIDDINGWNFIGNSNGENLRYEMTGLTRCYEILKKKYDGKLEANIADSNKIEFNIYIELKQEYEKQVSEKKEEINYHEKILNYLNSCNETLSNYFKKDTFSEAEVRSIKSKNKEVNAAKDFFIQLYTHNENKKSLENLIQNFKRDLDTRLNLDLQNREQFVGDNPNDINDTHYGNNLLNATGPYHGTNVASVIGALKNGVGINGIATCVKLMIIRIVPNGDERDKDIALAFRYAIRNGAKIINCSFAKRYSEHYEFVQDAIMEAEKNNVLIIHAAGNAGTNNDAIFYYPTGFLRDGSMASNWINVGASNAIDDKNLAGYFSNYGKKSVDVFAPGVDIRACALNNGYDKSSGTSIAAPVVSGLAAVIKSYYPYLTAKQIKEVILKSVYIPKTQTVTKPSFTEKTSTEFKDLSVSGGIVNLYRAVLLIEKEYKN